MSLHISKATESYNSGWIFHSKLFTLNGSDCTEQKLVTWYGNERKDLSDGKSRETAWWDSMMLALCFSCKNYRNTHTCKCRHVMVCLKILKTCISSNPVTFQAVNKYKTGPNWPPGFSGYLQYVCSSCRTEPQKPSYDLGFPPIKSSTVLKLLKTIAL